MEPCDICGCATEEGRATTRRLYSAEREEKLKDAAWSTSRVLLHLSDFQQHDVLVCAKCRREAWRWYLQPFLPFLVSLAVWGAWVLLRPLVAPGAGPQYVIVPALLVLVLLIAAPATVRRRYGMGEKGFGETPLRLFSLDNYLIKRLTEKHPNRVYWTPKWYRYYSRRFQ
ncbi:MAG: hypothetical protein GX649_14900 [Chloroflexi bacterium]|nr:hypothetical protein [Chloroflexota bacterium]